MSGHALTSSAVVFSVAKVRVGRLEGPDARDAQRPAARAERRAGPRQVQDAEADPPGQHQAPSRPVRVNVVSKRRHHQTSAACRTLCLLARRAPRTRALARLLHVRMRVISHLPQSVNFRRRRRRRVHAHAWGATVRHVIIINTTAV